MGHWAEIPFQSAERGQFNTTRQNQRDGLQTLHPIFLLEPGVPSCWSSMRRTGRGEVEVGG